MFYVNTLKSRDVPISRFVPKWDFAGFGWGSLGRRIS